MSELSELRQRAIRLLTRREHTRAELAGRLAGFGTEEEIATVLSRLESVGLICDARAAAAYVGTNAAKLGDARLRHDLRLRGVDPELAATAMAEAGSELERARIVAARKFPTPSVDPRDPRHWVKQARFMKGRGFSLDVIRQVLKERGEPEE